MVAVTNVPGEDVFHVGAKSIIIDSHNNILILWSQKKDGGYWDLPGGRVQVGEKLVDAARRELFEETGILLPYNPEFLGMSLASYRIILRDGSNVGLVYAFFKFQLDTNDSILLSSEHDKYHWLPINEAIQKVGYMGVTPFLEKLRK